MYALRPTAVELWPAEFAERRKATVGEGEVVRVEKRVIRARVSGRLDDAMDSGVRIRKRL